MFFFVCFFFQSLPPPSTHTDILLTADLFTNLRRLIHGSQHGLDPARYVTMGSLAVDAALKMADTHIQLVTCLNMHMFFEKALRGGYCCVSKRHASSNQPDLPNYDATQELRSIIYLDKNNLYGYVYARAHLTRSRQILRRVFNCFFLFSIKIIV